MLTFLFWNIGRRRIEKLIASAANERDVDILILAECEIPITTLLDSLNDGQKYKFQNCFSMSERLRVFTRFSAELLHPVSEHIMHGINSYVSLYHFEPPIGDDILFAAVHLPSKLYQDESDQFINGVRLISIIEEAEQKVGHARTLIVGDFNMNPFESGIAGADALHGVMDRRIAQKGSRNVKGDERKFFYNPMWNFFGDTSIGSPGTYYYNNTGQVNYFWNLFDQVLVRPELLDSFCTEDVEIITRVDSMNLVDSQGIPDKEISSDHLPILFRLRNKKWLRTL